LARLRGYGHVVIERSAVAKECARIHIAGDQAIVGVEREQHVHWGQKFRVRTLP